MAATTYLSNNLPNNSSGNHKFTYSCWVKRADLGGECFLLQFYNDDGNRCGFRFNADNTIATYDRLGNSTTMYKASNAVFKDTSAWYHCVLAVDRSLSTAEDRVKVYVNGEQITSWGTNTNYSNQNQTSVANSTGNVYINTYDTSQSKFSMLLSHVHFCDGQQLAPTVFGETDTTTGEWKIITDPSFTPGTNGFTILKDGNTITDQSANSNDWTLAGGTLTNMVDNPSDNFATVNISYYSAENVNATGIHFCNTGVNQSGTAAPFYSTIAVPSGKYYWEGFVETVGTNNMHGVHRTQDINQATNAGNPANGTYGYAYRSDGSKFNNGSATSYGNSFTTGDYISVAYDATNGAIWFAKNGTWQNSATTSEIAAGTTTNAAFSSMPTNGVFYTPYTYLTNNGVVRFNFGNGVFGSTALTGTTYSPTVGSTSAKFKYNIVPSGFAALSTKGLNA